jgi:hypothetical protein
MQGPPCGLRDLSKLIFLLDFHGIWFVIASLRRIAARKVGGLFGMKRPGSEVPVRL